MLFFVSSSPRGRAVYARQDIEVGAQLLSEEPLASMPLPETRAAIGTCARCGRVHGRITAQLKRLLGHDHLPALPMDDDDDHLAGSVPCELSCGALYCSMACRSQHAAHCYLCPAHSKKMSAAILRFESHALKTHEVFLFGARLAAEVLARGGADPFAALCRVPWHMISDEGASQSPMAQQDAKRAAAESHRLLLDVFRSVPAKTDWLTLDWWLGVLGAARRNSLCVELSHPVTSDFLPALRMWLKAQGESAGQPVKQMLDALPRPLPEPLSTALYAQISFANHSCQPNAEVCRQP